jgi:glycosyltransferase involved in cell wall biosynthesis
VGSTNAERGRVAVVSHGFYPSVGGSERYHWITATALTDEADVEVFTSDRNLASGAPAPPGRVPLGPIGVHYLPSRKLDAEKFVRPTRLWRALRRFDPDVVWGNHPSPTADVGALFALMTRRPWVATYHADVSTDRWRNRRYLALEMWLLRRARTVLVTSERYRATLVGRGVEAARIVVVPPGPFIGDGVLPVVSSRESGARPDAPFLFVGALDTGHAYKRLDILLRAFASLPRDGPIPSLDVVGEGDLRPGMEELARTLGISERVRFLGQQGDRELAERFVGARALILPSPESTEGFGNVAVEAIQYGCPVVVSSNVAVGDLLGPAGAAAVFDPAQPGSLGEVLLRLATDPAWRKSLAEGAKATAPSLRWDSLLGPMTAPVRELLRARRRRGGRLSPRASADPGVASPEDVARR